MKRLLLFSLVLTSTQLLGQASLNLDGVNDFVATPVVSDNTTFANWTLEAWVKSPNSPANSGGTGPVYGENMGLVWNHTQGAYRGAAFILQSNNAFAAASFGTLLGNTWYHLAATYDGSTLRSYVNGNLITSTNAPNGLKNSTAVIKMGENVGYYWGGNVDDVRIWSVARTCSEITNGMFQAVSGTETGLVAAYDMNEGTPGGNNSAISLLTNKVGNTADATLYNFNLTTGGSNFDTTAPNTLAITGSQSVCAGDIQMYQVPNITSSSNYGWMFPGTWTAASGADYFVNMNVGNSGGNVSATINHPCAVLSVPSINVSVTNILSTVTVSNGVITADASGMTYDWFECDGSGNFQTNLGVTTQSLTPNVSGSYGVEISFNGCTVSSDCQSVIPTGLDDRNTELFNVYPNPSDGNLFVRNSERKNYSLEIFDLTGRLIQTENSNLAEMLIALPVQSGIYFLVINSEGRVFQQKIIKK